MISIVERIGLIPDICSGACHRISAERPFDEAADGCRITCEPQRQFGNAFGLLVKELRLLARAVFVVDKTGVIRYIEIVNELTNEPNYEAALKAVQELNK